MMLISGSLLFTMTAIVLNSNKYLIISCNYWGNKRIKLQTGFSSSFYYELFDSNEKE